MADEKQIITVANFKMYLFFFCTFICSSVEFTPVYCIYVKEESNTLLAKVRPSFVWLNVSVLVNNSLDPIQIYANAVMIMHDEHF